VGFNPEEVLRNAFGAPASPRRANSENRNLGLKFLGVCDGSQKQTGEEARFTFDPFIGPVFWLRDVEGFELDGLNEGKSLPRGGLDRGGDVASEGNLFLPSANFSGAALTNALRCRRTVSVCVVLKRAKRGRFAYLPS